MLDKLTLRNNESHKRTVLEFAPGLNVFIGPTDAGKSGVLRGLYWLIFNRPLGDAMRPLFWDGTTKITAKFSDPAVTVSRIKGKKDNHYQINKNTPVNAGSGAPPPEVEKAIGMDSVNFQTQVERAYLMFEPPGERGRILNSIAGLGEIDSSIANATQDERRVTRELKSERQLLGELDEELEEYADLEEAEERVAFCEGLYHAIRKDEDALTGLNKTLGSIEELDGKIEKVDAILLAEEPLDELVGQVKELNLEYDALHFVSGVIKSLEAVTLKLEKTEDYAEMGSGLLALEVDVAKLEVEQNQHAVLSVCIQQLDQLDTKIEEAEEAIKETEEEIKQLKEELPDSCPTCGADICNHT